MKQYEPEQCRYCQKVYIPSRKNTPCCPTDACKAAHSRAWADAYKANNFLSPASATLSKRRFTQECEFCKISFLSKSNTCRTCSNPECQSKRAIARRNYTENYRERKIKSKKVRLESQARHRANKIQSSADGNLPETALSKVSGSLREKITNAWVDTLFDLHDQVQLLFLECQHIRGLCDPFARTLLREGTPSGCWTMFSLNKQRKS
jgi:hypothetical protein